MKNALRLTVLAVFAALLTLVVSTARVASRPLPVLENNRNEIAEQLAALDDFGGYPMFADLGGCDPSTDKGSGGYGGGYGTHDLCGQAEFDSGCHTACAPFALPWALLGFGTHCYIYTCTKDAYGCADGCTGHGGVLITLPNGSSSCK